MTVEPDAVSRTSDDGSIHHEEARITAVPVESQSEVTGTAVLVPKNSSSCIG